VSSSQLCRSPASHRTQPFEPAAMPLSRQPLLGAHPTANPTYHPTSGMLRPRHGDDEKPRGISGWWTAQAAMEQIHCRGRASPSSPKWALWKRPVCFTAAF